MGQQQLHLVVLGAILVFFSIAVGITSFNSNSVQSNRDAVIADLNYLSMMARGYYNKSDLLGGGNNDFNGFEIPKSLETTENGSYIIVSSSSQKIILEGKGIEIAAGGGCNQSEYVQYHLIVEPKENELVLIK
jgi:hypothetical protein